MILRAVHGSKRSFPHFAHLVDNGRYTVCNRMRKDVRRYGCKQKNAEIHQHIFQH